VLEAALGTPDPDDDGAARCREIVLDSGALASVETLVGALHARALQSLAGVPQPAQAALRRLARLAAYRSQ
jgi:geranylgeranyl diphosphate synthase type I